MYHTIPDEHDFVASNLEVLGAQGYSIGDLIPLRENLVKVEAPRLPGHAKSGHGHSNQAFTWLSRFIDIPWKGREGGCMSDLG